MRSLLVPFILSLSLSLSLSACAGRSADDDGGDSGGDGLDSETGGFDDAQLEMLCATGCLRLETCAPDALVMLYGDREACELGCFEQFSSSAECRAAAEPYASCTAALACEDWPDLLDGPATSKCSAEWAVVAPPCGLG